MVLVPPSMNHRFPSAAAVIVSGFVLAVGVLYSLNTPAVVTRPILLVAFSVNQRFPSGPTVIPHAPAFAVGTVNSVRVPEGVMRPIFGPSANQMFPSGPPTIMAGLLPAASENSVIAPVAGLTRPTRLAVIFTYQRYPSGPAVIPCSPAVELLTT